MLSVKQYSKQLVTNVSIKEHTNKTWQFMLNRNVGPVMYIVIVVLSALSVNRRLSSQPYNNNNNAIGSELQLSSLLIHRITSKSTEWMHYTNNIIDTVAAVWYVGKRKKIVYWILVPCFKNFILKAWSDWVAQGRVMWFHGWVS